MGGQYHELASRDLSSIPIIFGAHSGGFRNTVLQPYKFFHVSETKNELCQRQLHQQVKNEYYLKKNTRKNKCKNSKTIAIFRAS